MHISSWSDYYEPIVLGKVFFYHYTGNIVYWILFADLKMISSRVIDFEIGLRYFLRGRISELNFPGLKIDLGGILLGCFCAEIDNEVNKLG